MNFDELIRGDLIGCDWLDIFEDSVGNPDKASLARRHSIGYFWERRQDNGVPVIITTTTLDEDGAEHQGYCIYPEACISNIKIIKRKRRKKNGKEIKP